MATFKTREDIIGTKNLACHQEHVLQTSLFLIKPDWVT